MGLQYGFGSGVLYGIRNDISNGTPTRFGTLQDVSIDFNGEIKELYGQQQYPVDTARGKTKIQGKAKFAQISGPEFNNLFFGATQTTGQKLSAFNEVQTVSATTAQTISTAAAAISGANQITLATVAGLYDGMVTSGSTSIPAGATITAINAATSIVTLSAALTGAILINTPLTFSPLSLSSSAANTSGSPTLTFTSTTGVAAGQIITSAAAGFPTGTVTVLSVTGTAVTMSANSTAAIASGSSFSFANPPSATPANGGAGVFDLDLGVLYAATGLPFTLVSGTPVLQGTYSVNLSTGVYSFSPNDQDVGVLLNYTYTVATGYKITSANLLMGSTPRFEAVFTQTYNGNNLTLKLFACVSSKLTLPTKIDDYTINELDFMAYANAAGNVFELSTSS